MQQDVALCAEIGKLLVNPPMLSLASVPCLVHFS